MNATARRFAAEPAVREQVPLLLGLMGPSGGGKTYSALRLARGIQQVSGGEIYMIDTEARRGLHYADAFRKPDGSPGYHHVPFDPPHGSLDYLAAIEFCLGKGAGVIIVDSMSHEHEGEGGLLDFQEKEVIRLIRGDERKREAVKMLAWGAPKAARRKLINRILQMNTNFIFCFRAKNSVKPVKVRQDNGYEKTEVVHQGFMPIAGEEFVFEMTLNALLLPGAEGVPTWRPEHVGEKLMSKLPEQFRSLATNPRAFDEKMGADLATWARGGASPRPQPTQQVDRTSDDFPGDRRDAPRQQTQATTQEVPLGERIASFLRRVAEAPNETKLIAIKNASEKLRTDVDLADPERLLDMDEAYEARLEALREAARQTAGAES